jgi:alpha-mannosidase
VGRVPFRVRTVVRLVAGIDRVEVTTTLVNRARDHRLRVRFPAPDAGSVIRAEGHYAVIRRPARPVVPSRPDHWAELPQPEQHTTGFVAAGPLVVIGHGLPEYEALEPAEGRAGSVELALTLLRCVGWLSRDDLSTRPGGAGPAVETPDAQCLGEHTFRYDLTLDGDRSEAELVQASADARWPVVIGPAPASGTLPAEPPLRLGGDLAFAALKPAEAGRAAILRVYNPGSDRTPLRLEGDAEPWRVRLDESPLPDAAVPETVGPYEILTLRLEPRRSEGLDSQGSESLDA